MTTRAHLEQVQKATGKTPDALILPEFPHIATHVWDAFMSIHKGRSYGMSGPNPLSWGDIKDWSELNGIRLTPWENEVVKDLDLIWVNSVSEGADG